METNMYRCFHAMYVGGIALFIGAMFLETAPFELIIPEGIVAMMILLGMIVAAFGWAVSKGIEMDLATQRAENNIILLSQMFNNGETGTRSFRILRDELNRLVRKFKLRPETLQGVSERQFRLFVD